MHAIFASGKQKQNMVGQDRRNGKHPQRFATGNVCWISTPADSMRLNIHLLGREWNSLLRFLYGIGSNVLAPTPKFFRRSGFKKGTGDHMQGRQPAAWRFLFADKL
jgi:hypothetical protein